MKTEILIQKNAFFTQKENAKTSHAKLTKEMTNPRIKSRIGLD